MGGKSSTQTSQVSIPPQVLQQYQSVNQNAENVAQTPFQQYSTDPSAFVAPLNATQNAGIAGTNAAAGQAQPYYDAATSTLNQAQSATQPYYGAATGLTGAALGNAAPYNQAATGLALGATQTANPITGQQIGQYLSPYLGTVLGSESALLNQNNQQQQSGQLGNAIQQGAFGGDRAGIAAANLEQQQNLANANIYSGILNQGYNTALSTAQQQQAQQVAAQQTGAQNLAAIGQQQYSQGLGAANQLASLGQDVYSTGANTASALAGLGTGAQTAGLQGAQAQLAAGQTAQQTQQAGLTALYNQFLQQQSYPFQTAQFLANIAEGTGSLSGSTTTTTTPGGLLGSDRRMKEDIRKVGETFDGQPIYSFRYKGDKTTRIGLMAQDVEKKHPEAVGGLGGGLKGVDYEKATDDAAERGHFAYGGTPMLPGLGPADYSQLLQAQEQMYAPFAQQGGLYGGSAGGLPHGGSSYVPQANLPVSHLAVANAPPPRISPIEQANAIAGLAAKATPAVSWAQHQIGGLGGNDNTAIDDGTLAESHGGYVRRYATGGLAGYADGGMPYETGYGLDIPNDPNQHQLVTASNPTGSSNGSSGLGAVAGLAGDAIKAAPAIGAAAGGIGSAITSILPFLALKNGGVAGRHGYATDGTVDVNNDTTLGDFANAYASMDPNDPNNQQTWSRGLPSADAMNKAAPGPTVADMRAFAMGAPIGAQGAGLVPHRSVGQSHGQSHGQPNGLVPSAPVVDNTPAGVSDPSDPASATYGQPNDIQALADASANASGVAPTATSPVSLSPDQIQQPVTDITGPTAAGLGAIKPPPGEGQTGPLNGVGAAVGSGLGKLAGGVEGLTGGYFDKIAHGDAPSIVSLLAGIGAAGAAQTRYPLIALSQGLGAGANAYMQAKQQQANIAQTQAQAGLTGQQTALSKTEAYAMMQRNAPAGYIAVPGADPTGKTYPGPDGQPWHYELQANVTNFGKSPMGAALANAASSAPSAGIVPSNQTDQVMAQTYGIDPSQAGVANRTRMLALNPALAAQEDATEKEAQTRIGNLAEQDSTRRQLLQTATSLNSLSHGTLTGQGADSAFRAQLANTYQTVTGMLGIPPDPTVNSDMTAHQISEKIRQLSGAQLAHQAGERAASVQHALASVLPSGDLTPEATSHILAQMLVQNQQSKDFALYHNGYVAKYGTPIAVDQGFSRDMGPQYDAEQRSLSTLLADPKFAPLADSLSTGDASLRAQRIAKLDNKFGPNFHRYFTGGL